MSVLLVIGSSLFVTFLFSSLLFFGVYKTKAGSKANLQNLSEELESKIEAKEKIEAFYNSMVDLTTLRKIYKEKRSFEDSLRAERGRYTITQAELETVESRLRELEEIERELEASGLETKEEMRILQKKQEDLQGKNSQLKEKIAESIQKLNELMGEIELSSVVQEQMAAMQTELLQTEQKVDVLLAQIEAGNEQYFTLKKRYDALDIEYAQLYEKFAAA